VISTSDVRQHNMQSYDFFKVTVDNAATCSKCGKTVKCLLGNVRNSIDHRKCVHVEDWKKLRELDDRQTWDVDVTAETWVRSSQESQHDGAI
jgi:hypothetical protein